MSSKTTKRSSNCNVLKNYKNQKLATWVMPQREKLSHSKNWCNHSDEHFRKLNTIGCDLQQQWKNAGKRVHKACSHKGCTTGTIKGGACIKHGAKAIPKISPQMIMRKTSKEKAAVQGSRVGPLQINS